MRVSGAWVRDPRTQALCSALTAAGHRALFVGGCVRNDLLGEPVADIDIATDAPPETVTVLAENAGFQVVPTGVAHGTVTVVVQGLPHEVTTFRRDVETDGRRAVVAFSNLIEEDAARRDFTMNALYADPTGLVIDPLGGLADLKARCVRFVGQPESRITEDFLRILRFFRFHAWYGDPDGGLDAHALAACAALADGIAGLSQERMGAEMRKLLAAPDPTRSVASMAMAGILTRVIPGADPKALGPLVHLEAGLPPRWERRLAVLGGADPSDRLRLSRAESTAIQRVSDNIGSSLSPAALGWKLGETLARDVVLCRAALLESPLPDQWQAEIIRGAAAKVPVTSADLMPGLSGPDLGAKLKSAEARWLASDLRLTRSQLLD